VFVSHGATPTSGAVIGSVNSLSRSTHRMGLLGQLDSPIYPRILNPESIKETIARGVENGLMAYVAKNAAGKYQPFSFRQSLRPDEIDFSDDMYIIQGQWQKST